MAMVRLPTSASDRKANLHQGAIGAGIDLGSGMLASAVHRSDTVAHHPDTGNLIAGMQVPFWDRILMIAARACDMTGLGYIGADIVIDEDRGPLLLELNARPGIPIQVSNSAGLLKRLERIDPAPEDVFATTESRIVWARQAFPSLNNTRYTFVTSPASSEYSRKNLPQLFQNHPDRHRHVG